MRSGALRLFTLILVVSAAATWLVTGCTTSCEDVGNCGAYEPEDSGAAGSGAAGASGAPNDAP